jgi:hypothetical protein
MIEMIKATGMLSPYRYTGIGKSQAAGYAKQFLGAHVAQPFTESLPHFGKWANPFSLEKLCLFTGRLGLGAK